MNITVLQVDISRFSGEMRAEWEELKEFDGESMLATFLVLTTTVL